MQLPGVSGSGPGGAGSARRGRRETDAVRAAHRIVDVGAAARYRVQSSREDQKSLVQHVKVGNGRLCRVLRSFMYVEVCLKQMRRK